VFWFRLGLSFRARRFPTLVLRTSVGKMAAEGVAASAAAVAAGIPKYLLEKVGSDLVHLFDASKVAEDLQKCFCEAGLSSVKEFAAMFENMAALR